MVHFLLKVYNMACQHKFYSYLQLQRLTDFEPEIIIIGTFNPELPKDNYSEWFYGRTDNNYFWDLLPKMFGDEGLRNRAHTDWKKYCKRKKIALTDLLSGINDADFTNEAHIKVLSKYTDSDLATRFKDQIPNQVIPLLQTYSSIKSVYLTTTNNSQFWEGLWRPLENYCFQSGIWCRKLMTPSKGARFFMTKNSGISMLDFIYNDWLSKWNYNR